jgi:hypothetical protein
MRENEQKNQIKIKHGIKYKKNGWIYLSINGTASERGYANGFLLASELKEIFKMLEFNFMNSAGYSLEFFSEVISELYGPQIKNNYPEFYEEMENITLGANANGANLSLADIIMWNCYVSIDYLMGSVPFLIKKNKKLNKKYGHLFASNTAAASAADSGIKKSSEGGAKDHCTAFMAVGSYTKDGKIVCGHNSFDNFIDGQYFNVMLDLNPVEGHRLLMQTAPGCISSGTDYYVTSAGMICAETTIGGFNQFELKDPICCRIRKAMQYGKNLDECLQIIKHNNGGDYANSWLIGDTNTNTIMRIELGLKYINVEKKTDGYFIGFNAADDPRIRNLECSNPGYYDIRRHQGARRVRLTQLMDKYKGKIDVKIGEEILADHYDVYLNKINPCSRTCCSHYELDDRAFMSQSDRPKPYQPRGALDGIVCDTNSAKKMSLFARWGSSCGTSFEKTKYCNKNIQWKDQEPYLHDRLKQPWTEFSIYPTNNKKNSIPKNTNNTKKKIFRRNQKQTQKKKY